MDKTNCFDFSYNPKLKASLAGFEPATRCLEGSRSIQLSYRDMQSRQYKCNIGRECSQGKFVTVLRLPHSVNGYPEPGQAGNNHPGNQYTGKDGNKGMPELQPEKNSRQ